MSRSERHRIQKKHHSIILRNQRKKPKTEQQQGGKKHASERALEMLPGEQVLK